MARSAFTGGLFPTLLNHVGPLQGAWGHWGALIRLHGVSGCCQRPSRPTRSTVAVSVHYWGHTANIKAPCDYKPDTNQREGLPVVVDINY